LAEQAYHLEHDVLCQPVGKQDHYISAIGGITGFVFHQDGSTSFRPLGLPTDTQANLEDNLLLFFTGYARSASGMLEDQDKKSRQDNEEMIRNLHETKELGIESARALEKGNLRFFAEIMNVHWQLKRKRSEGMSNSRIDELYQLGMNNGALGGKLVGAGAGGFLMFYAEDKSRLRSAMHEANLKEVRMRFDFEGTQVMVHL
jgi:D-glycero-alpha-D-manno-heptose-7-phosphate kinase